MHLKSKTGWIEFFKAPTFNKDGSQFVYLTSQDQKELNDSYQHLTLVSMETGKQTPLTSGAFVVMDILYWNSENNVIYYAANGEDAPHIKHIWSVQADEIVDGPRETHCLTCNITRGGIPQTYFGATFSPNGKYIIMNNDGPTLPRTDIVKLIATNTCT